MFPQLLEVQALKKYVLFLRFSDGTVGDVDLGYLAQKGIFKDWDKNNLFEKVKIDPETNALSWNEMLELDPDSLYLKIRGLTFEEMKNQQFEYATN